MTFRLRAGLLALIVSVAPAPATAQAPQSREMSAEEQRQISWALERGRLLFALDRAAWVATDDLRARMSPAQQRGLGGYIVDRDEQGLVAIFYARDGDRLVAAYRGRIGSNGVASREVFPPERRPELTPRQRRLAATLEQLRSASPELTMCNSSSPNVAIVPPETEDAPIDLYVMTPQTANDSIPLGGHHRLSMDREGRIHSQRRFTKSCVDMPTTAESPSERPEALFVTHLLDPVPTEIHVFSAMAAQLPIYVGAGGSMWVVNGDSIRFVSRIEAPD